MKILYIGNDSIDNVVDAVTKRYSSLDVLVAKSMEQAMYLATRGDAIDRVILLDTVFTSALDIANTQKLRLAVQKLIDENKGKDKVVRLQYTWLSENIKKVIDNY